MPRWIKAVAGAIVIIALLIVVNRWWGEFRSSAATAPTNGTESSATGGEGASTGETSTQDSKDAEKTDTQPQPDAKSPADSKSSDKTVVILIDGLNFRESPSQDGNVIRGLDKGEKMTLVAEKSGWYQVKDSDDVEGWVYGSDKYTKVQ